MPVYENYDVFHLSIGDKILVKLKCKSAFWITGHILDKRHWTLFIFIIWIWGHLTSEGIWHKILNAMPIELNFSFKIPLVYMFTTISEGNWPLRAYDQTFWGQCPYTKITMSLPSVWEGDSHYSVHHMSFFWNLFLQMWLF